MNKTSGKAIILAALLAGAAVLGGCAGGNASAQATEAESKATARTISVAETTKAPEAEAAKAQETEAAKTPETETAKVTEAESAKAQDAETKEETGAAETKEEPGEAASSAAEDESHTGKAAAALAALSSEWLDTEQEFVQGWRFAVTDLDRNGRPELFSCWTQGSSLFSEDIIKELDEDGKNLLLLDIPERGLEFEMEENPVRTYFDPDKERWYYIVEDLYRNGIFEAGDVKFALCLKDGKVTIDEIGSWFYEYDSAADKGAYTYTGADNLSAVTFNQDSWFGDQGFEQSKTSFGWMELTDLREAAKDGTLEEKLQESYEIFLTEPDNRPKILSFPKGNEPDFGEQNEYDIHYDGEGYFTDAYVYDSMVDVRIARLTPVIGFGDMDGVVKETVAANMDISPEDITIAEYDYEKMSPRFNGEDEWNMICPLEYTSGKNEDTRVCHDIAVLTREGLHWFHTGTPADWEEEYADTVSGWLDSVILEDWDGSYPLGRF